MGLSCSLAFNGNSIFCCDTRILQNIPASARSRSNHYQAPLDWVLKLHIYTNKKDFDKSQSLFYGAGDGIRTLYLLNKIIVQKVKI